MMLLRARFLLLPLLAACAAAAFAQSGPDTLWTQTYGGSGNDWCYAVRQTADEGFIFAGQSNSVGDQHDVYLVRTDCDGDTLWTRRYGGSANDGARAIRQTADGGFIVAGSTLSFGAGLSDVYLLRLDAGGDSLWTRTFGGGVNDYGRGVVQAPDGGFVVAGITNSFGAGSSDVYLLKVSAGGDLVWSRTYGTALADEGRALEPAADGGFVIAGSTWNADGNWSDALLLHTGADGDSLWLRSYGGADQDWLNTVAPTTDGGYIAAGQAWLPGGTNPDIYLLKVNAAGVQQWTQMLSGPGTDEANAVLQTADGGFFLAGLTSPALSSVTDYYLVKTDSTGEAEWSRTYGGPQADIARTAIQTAHEGYVVGGETNSYGSGNFDYFVVTTGAAPQPGDTVRDLRVVYDPAGAGVELRWSVPRPGDYNIFSTTNAGAPANLADPAWMLEATVSIATPVAVWSDPDPLREKKFYVVTRDYGPRFSRHRAIPHDARIH